MSGAGELDQATARYVVVAEPVFATLRQVLLQATGQALVEALAIEGRNLQDAPLISAREALAEAMDALRAAPVSPRAAHYHHHLMAAADTLEGVLSQSRTPRQGRRGAISQALGQAERQLRTAARLLPGFEMVALGEACCACHRSADILPTTTPRNDDEPLFHLGA